MENLNLVCWNASYFPCRVSLKISFPLFQKFDDIMSHNLWLTSHSSSKTTLFQTKVAVQIFLNFHKTSETMFSTKYQKIPDRFSVSAENEGIYCFEPMSHRVLTHLYFVGMSTQSDTQWYHNFGEYGGIWW